MRSQDFIRKMRAVVIVILLTFGTGVFWSFLAAEGVRHLFGFDEDWTLILFGIPFFIVYCVWCARRLT